MEGMPEKIYLQDYQWSPDDYSETTWCVDKINNSDTEYVLMDLVDELIEAIAEAIAEALDDSGVSYTTNRVDAAIAKIKGEKIED